MLKAVIFDLDGVLLDNTQLIVEIFQEAAKRSGLKVPDGKKVIAALGLVVNNMIEILIGKGEKYEKILTQVWKEKEEEEKLMPGLKEVLTGLKTKKAIVTSAPSSFLKRRLKGFIGYFDVIITQRSTKKHKPNPEPLLIACKKLNIEPKEAVYVGDRIIDFETAKNAGMDFIGILSGGTSEEEFQKVGVAKIINSLPELLDIIK
jgi:HAD superfamily hydrolase (TIGR01549 family)